MNRTGNHTARLLLLTALVLSLGASAKAQSAQSELRLDPAPPAADQHRWNAQLFATGLTDLTNRDVTMWGGGAGVGYYVLENLAINLELSAFDIDQETGHALAGSASLGLRHHLFELGRASIFMDVAGGLMRAEDRMPRGGTHTNIIFHAGPGVAYPIGENRYIVGGARYFHLSNADREGEVRNPSINGIQGFIGIMFRF